MDDDEAAEMADEIEAIERQVRELLTPEEKRIRLGTIRMIIEISVYLRQIAEE